MPRSYAATSKEQRVRVLVFSKMRAMFLPSQYLCGTPTFFFKYVKTGIVEKDAENLLMYTSALLDEMEEILL